MNATSVSLGEPVPDWKPCPWPSRAALTGRFCRLEPLDAQRHGDELYAADRLDPEGALWTYLPDGPFPDESAFRLWLDHMAQNPEQICYAIRDETLGQVTGMACYLRINPTAGSIEVGWLWFSRRLQKTSAATEAMYLMMQYAFELGYRRYEWKCNALNEPSRRAARRLGFTWEGCFRQALVVKGYNRDTDWFSIIDREWPQLRQAFLMWLSPENFDTQGRQRLSLVDCRALASV